MNELFSGWRFVGGRLLGGWRMLLLMAAGIVAAATLLAAAPIYADAMSNLGLQYRLERGLEGRELGWLGVERLPLGDPVANQRRAAIEEITEARIGWLSDEIYTESRTDRLVLGFTAYPETFERVDPVPEMMRVFRGDPREGGEPERYRWGTFIYALSGLADNVTVVDGRLPGPPSQGAEVVLLDGFQRHAAVGDVVRFEGGGYNDCAPVPSSDDPDVARSEVRCRPSVRALPYASATIVGFVRPDDPDDPRWRIFSGSFEVPDEPLLPDLPPPDPEPALLVSQAAAGIGSLPVLTTEEQFVEGFGTSLPDVMTRHRVGMVPDIAAIGLDEVGNGIASLQGLREDLLRRLDVLPMFEFRLLDELSRFRTAQTFSQIPLLLILLQVVGVVIYYVVMVMTMLLDRQQEEISVYRSRGASTPQLVGLYLMEGVILAIPAAILGPLLASQVIGALGRLPMFEAMTGGRGLPSAPTPEAYLLAAAGATLTLLAMLVPAFFVARRGIVDAKRAESRPGGRSIIQRYYLDVAVVVLAGLLLWQLDQRGSVFDPQAVGGWSADPMLLLSPFVITLAVAAIMLRVYPPLVRLVVRVLLAFRGTAVAIGLRRAGRAPATYARLMLLLVMAVAVGTFAASYGPTVERSLTERERYDVGAHARANLSQSDRRVERLLPDVLAIEPIAAAAVASRGDIDAANGRSVPLLGVDPQAAASMLWFREDFADVPMTTLLQRLEPSSADSGLLLPDDATELRLAIYAEGTPDRAGVRAVFRDATGRYERVVFAWPEVAGSWERGVAPLPPPDRFPRPVTFMGLAVSDRLGTNLRAEGSLTLDALHAVNGTGQPTMIDDFEQGMRWTVFAERGSDETFALTSEQAFSGDNAARWDWPLAISPRKRVFAFNPATTPLPALVSESATGLVGAGTGGVGTALIDDLIVPIEVRGTPALFPTLNPAAGFIIVNQAELRELAGLLGDDQMGVANELWASFAPTSTLTEQTEAANFLGSTESPVRTQGAVRLQLQRLDAVDRDATLQAAGSGILGVAFVAVLAVSTLGFLVTLVLGARNRAVEFAVLRAVGSSPREILQAMVLEWGTVLVIGIAVGVLLGRQVAAIMLSFLEVTDQGSAVLPPFVLLTDWWTLGLGVGLLVLAVAIGLGLSWSTAMRRAAPSTLRLTR